MKRGMDQLIAGAWNEVAFGLARPGFDVRHVCTTLAVAQALPSREGQMHAICQRYGVEDSIRTVTRIRCA